MKALLAKLRLLKWYSTELSRLGFRRQFVMLYIKDNILNEVPLFAIGASLVGTVMAIMTYLLTYVLLINPLK